MPGVALLEILVNGKFASVETLVPSYEWNSKESETALMNALHTTCSHLVHLKFSRYSKELGADALNMMVGFSAICTTRALLRLSWKLSLRNALCCSVCLRKLRLDLERLLPIYPSSDRLATMRVTRSTSNYCAAWWIAVRTSAPYHTSSKPRKSGSIDIGFHGVLRKMVMMFLV